MPDRIYISLDQSSYGGMQLSIGIERADGSGHGYRIFGPKYDGGGKTLKRHYLTDRDAEQIRSYLKDRDGLNRQARNLVRLPDGNPASASAERADGDDIIDHRRQVGMPRDPVSPPSGSGK